jgi:hypothetical protein
MIIDPFRHITVGTNMASGAKSDKVLLGIIAGVAAILLVNETSRFAIVPQD